MCKNEKIPQEVLQNHSFVKKPSANKYQQEGMRERAD